jgi:hypothetical protein
MIRRPLTCTPGIRGIWVPIRAASLLFPEHFIRFVFKVFYLIRLRQGFLQAMFQPSTAARQAGEGELHLNLLSNRVQPPVRRATSPRPAIFTRNDDCWRFQRGSQDCLTALRDQTGELRRNWSARHQRFDL